MNTGTSECCIETATHGFNKNIWVFLAKYLNTYLQVMSHWPLSTDPLPPVLIIKLHTHPPFPSFSPAVLCPPKHPGESIIHLKASRQKTTTYCSFCYPSIYPELCGTKGTCQAFFQVRYSAVDFLPITAQCTWEFHPISASFPW